MKTKEPLYVGIAEPNELRKEILFSSKKIITLLKRKEEFAKLRQEKASYIAKLKELFDSMIVLNRKLRRYMPKENLPRTPVFEKEQFEPPKKEEAPAPKNTLDILEEQLAKIEEKLSMLE